MTVAQRFWDEARVIAEECLAHPFVRGIADGSLDLAKYGDFIAQDAYFLAAFARGYAHCLAHSPDRDGLDAFHRLLDGVFEELELHRDAAERLGIDLTRVEPAPPTLAYTRFLAEAITAGTTTGEMLAALTPCMRLYAYLGAETARVSASPANPYHEWIETYSSEQFQQRAALVESLLDRYASGSLAEREHYRRAMELERRFFDAAWQGWRSDAAPDPAPLSTEALIERHHDAWLEATAAPMFVREIREGTLDDAAWRRWLAQDYLFVEGLYGAQARILALTQGEARRALLDGLLALQAELDWFREHAERLGLDLDVEASPDCRAYVRFLDSLAFAPPTVGLTAIWAVERAYLDAWRAARPGAAPYREFVEHWTNEAFSEYVTRLRAGADEALSAAAEERGQAERAFLGVVAFERRFWEMTGIG